MAGSRAGSPAEHQEQVNRHFDAVSLRWRDLYGEPTVDGIVHQLRLSTALAWIDELPAGARAVDIGCGAGLLSVELARRGYGVLGVDPSPSMVELARSEVAGAGVANLVSVAVGDAHSLDVADESCALILALGVIAFLHSPKQALSEMRRILEPGGHAILSMDNAFRFSRVLDPRYTPFPGRDTARRALRRFRSGSPELPGHRLFSSRQVRAMVRQGGLDVLRSETLGFGPFTLLGRRVFSDERGVALHRRLQHLADRRWPVVRSGGSQILVLARKPD